jgi:uncharacterized membrane protein YeaQ/YmgE (transglycosylase-associated protein family)
MAKVLYETIMFFWYLSASDTSTFVVGVVGVVVVVVVVNILH